MKRGHMAILPIRTVPDPVLRKRAARVTSIDKGVRTLLDDLLETMRFANGVGLAAPQVGVSRRMVVIEIPGSEEDGTETQTYKLINPQVIKRAGEREVEEGCLSVPGYIGYLLRAVKVTAKALDPSGKEIRIKATDLLAQALEHEIDHLNGILFLDHLASHEKLVKLEPGDSARKRREGAASSETVTTTG